MTPPNKSHLPGSSPVSSPEAPIKSQLPVSSPEALTSSQHSHDRTPTIVSPTLPSLIRFTSESGQRSSTSEAIVELLRINPWAEIDLVVRHRIARTLTILLNKLSRRAQRTNRNQRTQTDLPTKLEASTQTEATNETSTSDHPLQATFSDSPNESIQQNNDKEVPKENKTIRK